MDILAEYNRILQEVIHVFGHDTTTTDIEINKHAKKLLGRRFKGTFAKDQVPHLKRGQMCISNLDTSSMPGSHWVALYCSGPLLYVYDSFGRHLEDIGMDRIGGRLKTRTSPDYDAEQPRGINSTSCGQRSVSWLLYVCKHGIKSALKI